MYKRLTKILELVLVVLLFVFMPSIRVNAAENVKDKAEDIVILKGELVDIIPQQIHKVYKSLRATTFSEASTNVNCKRNGIEVYIITSMSKEASIVGVKDIVIQRKVGSSWETVAYAEGAAEYDTSVSIYQFSYDQAIKGSTYRITCTHYADVDGYRELSGGSGEFVYTY